MNDYTLGLDPWNELGAADTLASQLIGVNAMNQRARKLETRLALREWHGHAMTASRTCWDTGQPYVGLGCWLRYQQRRVTQ